MLNFRKLNFDNNNEIKNYLIKKENEMVEIKPNNDDNCDNNDK